MTTLRGRSLLSICMHQFYNFIILAKSWQVVIYHLQISSVIDTLFLAAQELGDNVDIPCLLLTGAPTPHVETLQC